MRIIARKTLRVYWDIHPEIRQALQAWYHDVRRADWRSPNDVKSIYANASIIGNDRVVFNIKGNRYRLVVVISYRHGIVFIRFIGTHREYDPIDAERI